VVIFFAGFCLMTIELVAGRVIAPFVGASLSTWTSVIGAVLLGITLGNAAGGWLADRAPKSRVFIPLALVLASAASGSLPWLVAWIGPRLAMSSLPFSLISALLCGILFFPAAFFLSTISPQIVRRTLPDLERLGSTVGRLGAWGAAGSILGTFVSGFVFLMFFDLTHILFSVSTTLLLLAAAFSLMDRL